jgi:hypothetical protein
MNDRSSMTASAASPGRPERQTPATPGGLRPSAMAFRDEAFLSPVLSIGRNGLRGKTALHSPGELRWHPAFNELNLAGWLVNSELKGKPQNTHEPILITQAGKKAHPCLIEALHDGKITINAALELCEQEKSKQVEQLAMFLAEGLNSKSKREFIDKLQIEKLSADVTAFLSTLQQFEAMNPGSRISNAGS